MKYLNRRDFLTVAGAAAGTLALAACGGEQTTDEPAADEATDGATDEPAASGDLGLITEGTLTVAVSPDFPPFENLDGDEYVGFDIDLMKAVAEQMGLEVEFKNLQFDAIVPAIQAGGQADVGCSGITIDDERLEQVDFSTSYYIDDQCVVAMIDNADVTADTYEDALNQDGVVIAVQSGTTGETYAQENFPAAKVVPYGNATDCFAAMQAGTDGTVAVVTNLAVGEKMVAEAYTDAQIVGKSATGEEYGVAVSKDNPALLDAVNAALAALDEDGTIDELTTTWMG